MYYTTLYSSAQCCKVCYIILYSPILLFSSTLYHYIRSSTVVYYSILYHIILYNNVVYCTILCYTVLYCTVLYYTMPPYNIFHYIFFCMVFTLYYIIQCYVMLHICSMQFHNTFSTYNLKYYSSEKMLHLHFTFFEQENCLCKQSS